MTDLLNAPIPGQSLTDEPKNYPWERPPEITDPRQAVKFHIEGLNEPDALDNIVELMQMGLPVRALAKTALTTAQMEGIHSVDVSLIIRDAVYEELITIAEEAGVDYVTGDEPSEAEAKAKEEQETLVMLRKKLREIDPDSPEDDAGVEFMRQAADTLEGGDMSMDDEQQQEEQDEMPMMDATDEAPLGLMARG